MRFLFILWFFTKHSYAYKSKLPLPTPPPKSIPIQQKISDFTNLARLDKNILPTTVLSLLSTIVSSPHGFQIQLPNPSAVLMVHLLTASSMVVNDLWDIEPDRINNPTRPIPSGRITQREAILFTITLIGGYVFLGETYIPRELAPIWQSVLIEILLYTPILKKIPAIKNLTCSTIVALSVPFIGFSTYPNIIPSNILEPKQLGELLPWLPITINTLFANSATIEVLLDISDRKGDERSGINTLPVIFGPDSTIRGHMMFLTLSYFDSIWDTIWGQPKPIIHLCAMFAIAISYLPLFSGLIDVKKSRFSKPVIKQTIKNTTMSLLVYTIIAGFAKLWSC